MIPAARKLLDTSIDFVNKNRLVQAGLGAGASYLGAQAINYVSPYDIDPEAAATAGFFLSPAAYRQGRNFVGDLNVRADNYARMNPTDPMNVNRRRALMDRLGFSEGMKAE